MSATHNEPDTKLATFRLSPADYAEVERIAEEDDRSVSAVLRIAVRRYLEERKAP